MADEGKREFWKYALFTAASSVLVGHMFYTMWLNGTWRYASDLASAIAWVPDGPTGVIAGLLFGFGVYVGFLLVFMQNRRKYYQGVILLVGTVAAVGLLAALGLGIPGFEPTPLNGIAFSAGLVVVVLAEMIDIEITVPAPAIGHPDGGLIRPVSLELEGRLHQIDLGRSSWGYAVDTRGNELTFPVATYGLLAYILLVVLVSNVLNVLVVLPEVSSLQAVHVAVSGVFLWVLGSFVTLNPSADSNLQVLGPTQSGKTYFVLAAALEAGRSDRFEITESVGWINELVQDHKEWARKNRQFDRDVTDWDISDTDTSELFQTNFTVTTNDRIPRAFHFNVVDHAGEFLDIVADRVGNRAVTDGGTDDDATSYVCPECGETFTGSMLVGDICPECTEGSLRNRDRFGGDAAADGGTDDDTDDESVEAEDRDIQVNNRAQQYTPAAGGDETPADKDEDGVDDREGDAGSVDAGSTVPDDADPTGGDDTTGDDDQSDDITGDRDQFDDATGDYDQFDDATGDHATEAGPSDDATEGDDTADGPDGATDETEDSERRDESGGDGWSSDGADVGGEQSFDQAEVLDRLEEKVLGSDTLVFMLDCERLIGGAPAGTGSESLETAEMNRIVNGAAPENVLLVATKADVLIDDWKGWYRARNDTTVDSQRLQDPHELDEYEESFQRYVTDRFEDETGMLTQNVDSATVYPVYFETQLVDTSDGNAVEGTDRHDDEWVPAPNANGELQPHGYDRVLAAIAQDW